jgi:hypothetical protein
MVSSARLSPKGLLLVVACSLGLVVAAPAVGDAQPVQGRGPRPELFGSVAWGHQFIGFDAEGFGAPNIGGGVAFRPWSRFGIELEVNRSRGSSRKPQPGFVGVVMVATANVSYFFGGSRAQPFLSAGYGALWSTLNTNVQVIAGKAVVTDFYQRRGTAPAGNIAAGILIPVTGTISLRPEFRFFGSGNAGFFRTSIGVGYHW